MAINFPNSPTLYQIFNTVDNSFIWNGTAWVGYSTSLVVNYNASSVVIQDDNSIVGATTSINFGDNLSVSAISAGIVTVTGSASGSSSQFVTTAAGIHTLSNVGIGTTNPTSALTVTGNGTFTGVVTATTLNVGTGGTIITTTTAGLVGIGTTNPTSKLTVGAVGAATTNFVVNGWANISGIDIRQSSDKSLYIGEGAGQSNINVSSDYRNVAIGYEVLNQNSGGDYNVVIGSGAMKYGTGNYNVIIGNEAGDGVSFTGTRNVFMGAAVGGNATAADYNTIIGHGAGEELTNADYTTIIGYGAGQALTVGDTNIFIGADSGSLITTGNRNTIIGSYNGNQNGLDIRTLHSNVVLSDGYGNIRFYANSSGNVGLGTTNPRFKLEVGAVGASGTSFYVNGNARVTGVLALGLASILLDGDTNTISVGAGITISGSTGIISATSFYGDTSNAVDGRWTIGDNVSSEYTFTGIGFTQTTNNPVLYLGRGRVYEFVITSGSSHPFEIRLSNGGSAYIGGVVGNGATNGGIVRFEIPFNSPNTLYYQCTNHSGMGNTISVYPSTI